MRYTRHARNRMRQLKVSPAQVEAFIASVGAVDRDPEGRPRYVGEVAGVRIRVVIAADDPTLIVSIHRRRS